MIYLCKYYSYFRCTGRLFLGCALFVARNSIIAFFVYSHPLPKRRNCWMAPIYKLLGVVFCVMISWVNNWKYENILQFNTSWLVFLRTWYYFRLYFSFSYAGYDLTLIKESHTLNCYSFLQKFLLKAKAYKLVVGNCVSSNYC